MEPIQIDGSFLEGGGQIVRTALGLSALLGKPFVVNDIRKGRKKSGLKPQHLTAIKALAELCGAETNSVSLGSESLSFTPGKVVPQTLSIDIGTAGSVSLLLQSLWPVLVLGGGKFKLNIKGGTDVNWSMPYDYLKEVFVPQMQRYADVELKLVSRGFYPKGGGEMELKVKGKYTLETISDAPALLLEEQGHLMQIKGVSYATKELAKAEVAERQQIAAKRVLAKLDVPIIISTEYCESASTGSGIVLWAIFSKDSDDIDVENPIRLGADTLGERGKKAEIVGEEAAKKLLFEIEKKGAVDQHLCDNLIPFVALFGGKLKTSFLTNHSKTNVYAVEKFLGKCLEVDDKLKIVTKQK